MLRLERALDWLSNAATMDRASLTGVGSAGGYAEAEEVGFHGGYAVQAPGGVGQGLDQVLFGGADGTVCLRVRSQAPLVGCEVLAGHDYDLAGEAVAECVQG